MLFNIDSWLRLIWVAIAFIGALGIIVSIRPFRQDRRSIREMARHVRFRHTSGQLNKTEARAAWLKAALILHPGLWILPFCWLAWAAIAAAFDAANHSDSWLGNPAQLGTVTVAIILCYRARRGMLTLAADFFRRLLLASVSMVVVGVAMAAWLIRLPISGSSSFNAAPAVPFTVLALGVLALASGLYAWLAWDFHRSFRGFAIFGNS